MGTIVINQTDCKQNVVLTSSLDGISGGYYDAEGVWHEMGLEKTYFEMPFRYHTSVSTGDANSKHYAYSADTAKRICSYYPCENPGKTFKALSSDFKINLIGILDLDPVYKTVNNSSRFAFEFDGETPSYEAEASSTAPYVWLAISKTSAEFTTEEVMNPLGTVFEMV